MTLLLAAMQLSTPARAQDCMDLVGALREISAALDEVRIDDASRVGDGIEAGLLCQDEVINPVSLTALLQVAGAVRFFAGDEGAASERFAQAVALSPGARLDPQFGADAEALYESIRTEVLAQAGGSLESAIGIRAWADGRELTPGEPVDLAPGDHLIQIDAGTGRLSNERLRVSPGERLLLSADGAIGPAPTPAEAPDVAGRGFIRDGDGPRWGLVAAGGLGLASGGASLWLAADSHRAFDASQDPDALDGLRLRTNALAVAGFALGGAGAGLAVGGFVAGAAAPGGLIVSGRW